MQSKRDLRSGSTSSPKINITNDVLLSRIDELTKVVNSLKNEITSAIDKKIQEVFLDVNNKINCLSDRIETIEQTLLSKNNSIETTLETISKQTQTDCKIFKEQLNDVGERLTALETNPTVNNEIDERIVHLERLSHNCDLIISGIPPMCRDLDSAVNNIYKTLNVPLDKSCSGAIFRLRNGSVVVKFISTMARQQVFSNYLKFARLNVSHIGFDGDQRIYINESLCKETARLLKMAIRLRRGGHIFSAFTRRGHLFIRKTGEDEPIKITYSHQLNPNGHGRPSISRYGELLNDPNFIRVNAN